MSGTPTDLKYGYTHLGSVTDVNVNIRYPKRYSSGVPYIRLNPFQISIRISIEGTTWILMDLEHLFQISGPSDTRIWDKDICSRCLLAMYIYLDSSEMPIWGIHLERPIHFEHPSGTPIGISHGFDMSIWDVHLCVIEHRILSARANKGARPTDVSYIVLHQVALTQRCTLIVRNALRTTGVRQSTNLSQHMPHGAALPAPKRFTKFGPSLVTINTSSGCQKLNDVTCLLCSVYVL